MANSDANPGNSHASNYMKSVASTLVGGKYSDLTITCKGEIFKVHRTVVCLQSKPLAAHIDGVFREAMTGVIDLADDEPATVANMIDYFYKGDYGKGPDALDYWHPLMLITHTRACTKAAHAYIIADKYDVPGLKELARAKYEHIVEKNWEDASFTWSLKLMYDKTPQSDRALKDVAIKTAAAHAAELMATKEFVRVLHENGEIGSDILKATLPADAITEYISSKERVCPLCQKSDCYKVRYTSTYAGASVYYWVCERCDFRNHNNAQSWW